LPDIGESDLIYTESLMRRGTENYADKEVLILGGGDGALLCELLKENPKKVTMIEVPTRTLRSIGTNFWDAY
jgi:spermine synthase